VLANNYFTKPDRRPPKSKDKGEIDEIFFKYSSKLTLWARAKICGAIIKLGTDSEHVYNYWKLNWFQYNGNKHEDGIIYNINGVPGYSPHLYYDLDRKYILIVNCEYYGTVKSAGVLGLAGVILRDKYPIHGACIEYMNTYGIVLIAPTGTGKTTQSHELLYNVYDAKVHSDDYVFISFIKKNTPIACATEKQLYMRTDIAKSHPTFISKFKLLPNENVRNNCYWAYGNSRVMFPRHMFPTVIKDEHGNLIEVDKGSNKVINKTIVKYIMLLTRNEDTKPISKLDYNNLIKVLEEGKYIIRSGAGPEHMWGKVGYEPFYNPYPPELDKDRQRELFKKLYDCGVQFYLLNTGSYKDVDIQPHQTHSYIRHILEI